MNSKIVCGVIFVLFCVFQLGYAIKCYRCKNESECKNAQTFECNQFYANETYIFLDAYYQNVNTSQVSNSYACMRQDLKFSSSIGTVKYKGCVYAHVNSCGLAMRSYYANSNTQYGCRQCNDRNGCNPADRKSISTAAIFLSMFVVLIYKHFM